MMVKRDSFLRLNFINLHQPAAEAKRRNPSQRDHREDAFCGHAASESFAFDSDLLVMKKTEQIETTNSTRF